MRRAWRRAAAWAVVILVATSVPLPGGGMLGRPFLLDGFLQADKLVHVGLYAVLGWLLVGAWGASGRSRWTGVAGVLATALVFAALDEWHQAWIPTRSPEVVDWMADAAGLILGATARGLRERAGRGSRADEPGRDEDGSEGRSRDPARGRAGG